MLVYLAQRLAHLVALVAVASLLTFVAGAWAPGTYEDALRLEPAYSPSTIAAIRARDGLDEPAAARFARWLGSFLRGGLGVSVEYRTAVAPLVAARAVRTLLLGIAGTSLAWLVALPAGVLMAARAGTAVDRCCRAALAAILALPEPVLAIGLMLFAAHSGWFPAGGMLSARLDAGTPWLVKVADSARHLVLPASVLGLSLVPTIARHVRSSVAAVLSAPFVTAARARGVPERRLLFRSALRVAAAPLISLAGLSLAALLSASLLVEVVTGWPGLGPLLVEATRSRDLPVVAGATVCSMVMLTVGTTLSDVFARVADPRIRLSAGGAG
jgi:peptide/nickel transport system permease protein